MPISVDPRPARFVNVLQFNVISCQLCSKCAEIIILISHEIKILLFANGVTNLATSLLIAGKGKTLNAISTIKQKLFATFAIIQDILLEITVQN